MGTDKIDLKTTSNDIKAVSGTYSLKDFLSDNTGVFVHPAYSDFKYEDGGEKYVQDVLKNTKDLSSGSLELIGHIKDWPSRYHLSYRRSNFFEALSPMFNKDSRVLEIGSGCGAITRWLGERFTEVDAVEGSYARATATRSRTKDLKNVNVYCGDVLNTSFDRNYDIITLIGVLEYVPFYDTNDISAIGSCVRLLKRLSASLNDNGMLVLAIENKLGAKYFSGCTEDHTGKLFDGIAGYPDRSAITFSRAELEDILKTAGFKNIQFYHLFPDYKMAETLIAENKEAESLRPYNWIKTPFEDYSGNRQYFLPEQLMLKTMTDAGLLWQFSNSFLVLASPSDAVDLKPEWLIKKLYNSESHDRRFHHMITLEKKDEDGYVVRRDPLIGSSHVDLDGIEFKLEDQEYAAGELLITELYRSLLKKDQERSMMAIVKKLHDGLIAQYGTGKLDGDGYPLVKGEAVDYTFWNVLSGKDGEFYFIDRKWRSKADITADLVLFRSLYFAFDKMIPFVNQKNMSKFIIGYIKELYPQYDIDRLMKNLADEEAFQSIAGNKKVKLSLDIPPLYSISGQASWDGNSESRDFRIRALKDELHSAEALVAERDGRILAMGDELSRMKRSTVWRLIGAFDRLAGRVMPVGTRRGRLYGFILRKLQGLKAGKSKGLGEQGARTFKNQVFSR